jgi:hypothetical protein
MASHAVAQDQMVHYSQGLFNVVGAKVMKVKLLEVGVPNANGVVYNLNSASTIIIQGKKRMSRGLLGELCPTTVSSNIDLTKVSHKITNLSLENGAVHATIEVLKTPMGNILQNLLDAGVEPKFAVRGYGYVGANGTVHNFQLVSIDVVNKSF